MSEDQSHEEKRQAIMGNSQEVGRPQPEDEMAAYPTDDTPEDSEDSPSEDECDVTMTLAEWMEIEPQLASLRELKKQVKLLHSEIVTYKNCQKHLRFTELNTIKERIFVINETLTPYVEKLQFDTRMELKEKKESNS